MVRSRQELREVTPTQLEISLCGIILRNPVLAASGTFAYGVEFESLMDLNALGGLVVKGLSREPMDGNPPPRIWEAEAGMINSLGVPNVAGPAFFLHHVSRVAGATAWMGGRGRGGPAMVLRGLA